MAKKRKRDEIHEDESRSEEDDEIRAHFQRAFEARFEPLEVSKPDTQIEQQFEVFESSEHSDESGWNGISEDESLIEVVDHGSFNQNDEDSQEYGRKAFMSSRPPSLSIKITALVKSSIVNPKEDSAEAANLKNDLALQRLLKESHLLDSSAFTGKITAPEGKGRQKALDLRLQGLGAKQSVSDETKMPLSHRRGIATKAASREERRRNQAAENGVVLEKVNSAVKSAKRREKGIDGPAVGKFKNGALKLSSRDVKSIQGPKNRSIQGRKGRR